MQTYSQTLPLNELIGGRYRVQSVLGEGGFGITYKARDEKLQRPVVIKEYLPGEVGARARDTLTVIPRTHREQDFQFGLKRYLEEAVTLARFKHPNIVRIIDHLEANGTAYIVMDFEEGETLVQRLKRGRLTTAEILVLLPPLLLGLEQVHQAGLLHRDIKPGNLFLRPSGEPLLIDFGSARHALSEHSKSLSAIVSPGYAPPEQYSTRGKQGPWTDLYGLGAVLYELITGQAPPDALDRNHQVNEGDPDPLAPAVQAGATEIPLWLRQLADRMLVIRAKDRPQNCAEVLAQLATGPDAPAIPRTRVISEAERFGETRVVAEAERFGDTRVVPESKRFDETRMVPNAETEPPVLQPSPVAPPSLTTPPPPVQFTGQLQVNVNVSDAVVYLDGKQAGKASPDRPLNLTGLSAGSHSIRVDADECRSWQEQSEIRRGEWTQIVAELKRLEKARRDELLGMEFVLIEAGSFLMGSPSSEKERNSDERQHPMQVGDFYLGKYPVTNAQYRRFKPKHDSGRGFNGEDQPVVLVSWVEATAYAAWLSRETGENYRLPTEAEWEYACRAGTTSRYSFGEDERKLAEHAWYSGNAGGISHPVGQKRPNPWGLYDMHGNVWEWTSSAYDKDYGGGERQCAGKSDANIGRVARGGSWFNFPRDVRSAKRNGDDSSFRLNYAGFRLARVASGAERFADTRIPKIRTGLSVGNRLDAEGYKAWQEPGEIRPGEWTQIEAGLRKLETPHSDRLLGMEFILIEAGLFLMGSPSSEKERNSDERQHPVQIVDFYLGKYPVTNAQYRRFKPDHDSGKGFDGGNQPVVRIGWEDAMAFAEWLSRETGEGYRLPTEAEWEYACRAGTTSRYFFGDDKRELGEYAWYFNNSGWVSHPVGEKETNPWGLFDMHGNVWEWTCSAYDKNYGGGEKQCASKSDAHIERVLRGGSGADFPRSVRSAKRFRVDSSKRFNDTGFRLARIVSP